VTGLGTIRSSFTDFLGGGTKSTSVQCVNAKLVSPPKVSFADWESMDLRLTGDNNCKEKVQAFIMLQATPPPFKLPSLHCDELKAGELMNRACHEKRELKPGPIDWKLSKPQLRSLKLPIGKPVLVAISWSLYGDDDKQVGGEKAEITVQD
jgi:hypothetical protein